MKKIKFLLKVAIVLGIAFAFVAPASAMVAPKQTTSEKNEIHQKFLETLQMNPGWEEQASNFWEASRGINYICALDENIAWASGYDGSGSGNPVQEFTKTVNGGTVWEADVISSAPSNGDLAMICAVDEYHAWVPIHSGTPQGIWATTDGGDTWARQTTADFSGAGAFPNVVHFWDVNNGWCQGDPVDGYFEMYTTTDGGNTWTRVPSANIPAPLANEWGTVGYYDVVGDTVWFGTQCSTSPGRIFKSEDRGLTWTVANTPFPSAGWVDVRMRDANNGLAMDKRSTISYLAETNNGGATWVSVTPTGPFYGYDIAYVPGTANMWISTGAASGASGASYSVDGGHSWVDFPEVLGTQLLDCDFVAGGIGWAGAFSQDEYTGGVWKYTPGENLPPSAPIINGPAQGKKGVAMDYGFTSADPEGDDIDYYTINWGDGTGDETLAGPFTSGVEQMASHTWAEKGTYVITATATDINGAKGPQGTFSVSIPRTRANYTPFLNFLESHPNAFPLLQMLLKVLNIL